MQTLPLPWEDRAATQQRWKETVKTNNINNKGQKNK